MSFSLKQLCGVIIQEDALPKSVLYSRIALFRLSPTHDAQGDLGWGNYAVRLLLSPDKEPSFQAVSEEHF